MGKEKNPEVEEHKEVDSDELDIDDLDSVAGGAAGPGRRRYKKPSVSSTGGDADEVASGGGPQSMTINECMSFCSGAA